MKIFTVKKKPVVNIEKQRQEKLTEIGNSLRESRQAQGITLETVAQKTRIQKRLLSAIEEGNVATLPEPVYIRELIKRFANILGLDGTQLAGDFPIESGGKSQARRGSWLRFIWALPAFNLRASHLYLLYILLVMFAVKEISQLVQPSSLQVTNQEDSKPTPSTSSINIKTLPSPSVVVSNKPQLNPQKPVVVNITVKDQTWVMVTVDGKKEFEGTLTKGTHRTWVADKQLTILTGNAGGMMVAFKDEKARQLGKPGQVQKVTFQANAGS